MLKKEIGGYKKVGEQVLLSPAFTCLSHQSSRQYMTPLSYRDSQTRKGGEGLAVLCNTLPEERPGTSGTGLTRGSYAFVSLSFPCKDKRGLLGKGHQVLKLGLIGW